MKAKKKNPRILIVTPEITYLPEGMGNMSNKLQAKAGGLADVSASLVSALFRQGADIHVALPHYRRMFHVDVGRLISSELRVYTGNLSNNRIHLAEDRIFYYRDSVYSNYDTDSVLTALAFEREVINNIIPLVQPDLIHCNDWMTGLVPAFARRLGIPCLFTVHNIHTKLVSMAAIEDRGIDAAEFWKYLFFERQPYNYEESRSNNRVDQLASGIFAAHYINTVSPTFLQEVVDNRHSFIPADIQREIANKAAAGCAVGILNAPDESYQPESDGDLEVKYGPADHYEAKRSNKTAFQLKTGLRVDPDAPLFFWPSRLDPIQKGCQLLTDILYKLTHDFPNLQIAIVANGSFQKYFRQIVALHSLYDQVSVCDFDEGLSHLGFAASDFMLMPSLFEPCGLPQMASQLYGSLPVVHDTGGLHDTVEMIDVAANRGNGFVFKDYDAPALYWAVGEAMKFAALPKAVKEPQIARVMEEAKGRFNHDVTASKYIEIYEKMLQRPLVG
ncbi:glycogen synthase [Victivallis sp. Marseille-Q1083]|uniref:glycogen synthase n=1 Tax=Victivallis sp. Marseille-Q1083 TaxID=2717288 RepID=UPI00158EAE8B|nr:glycogen/starch synthase [Victivallis sp. Marseille-Q1083]